MVAASPDRGRSAKTLPHGFPGCQAVPAEISSFFPALEYFPGLGQKTLLVEIHGVAVSHTCQEIGNHDLQVVPSRVPPATGGKFVWMIDEIAEQFAQHVAGLVELGDHRHRLVNATEQPVAQFGDGLTDCRREADRMEFRPGRGDRLRRSGADGRIGLPAAPRKPGGISRMPRAAASGSGSALST